MARTGRSPSFTASSMPASTRCCRFPRGPESMSARPRFEYPRRIADDGRPGRHVLGHHGAHADHRALADCQRLAAAARPQEGAGADIGIVLDDDPAVAAGPRGEGHEIADDAVMSDVSKEVRVEMAADPAVGGDDRELAQHRPVAD